MSILRKLFKDEPITEKENETMHETQKRIKKQIERGRNNPNATDFEKGLAEWDRQERNRVNSWENSIYNPNRVIDRSPRDPTNSD